jgi:hypothetical protein
VSEPGLTNPWELWQRLIDSIGPYYRGRLFSARDEAKREFGELDDQELGAIAAEGRRAAGTLDEEGARLAVRLTGERERHSRVVSDLQREAELLARRRRWALSPGRRRRARAEAADRGARAAEHRRLAAEAHEQLRQLGSGGRHLYPWFERHQEVLLRGLAAEVALDAAHSAVYHVLGAPGIAALTAACLTSDRAIDIGEFQRLVGNGGDARQRCCSRSQPSYTGVGRACRSASCSPNSMEKTWTACSTRSPWSSGAGSRSRGRLTISGYGPPNPRAAGRDRGDAQVAVAIRRLPSSYDWSHTYAPRQGGSWAQATGSWRLPGRVGRVFGTLGRRADGVVLERLWRLGQTRGGQPPRAVEPIGHTGDLCAQSTAIARKIRRSQEVRRRA